MRLHELAPSPGSKRRPKRLGRGPGSGHGKTSTKGHKGLLARSGGGKRPGFEGGQMPLSRRLPKYGFSNPFRKEFEIVNLKSLTGLQPGQAVTPAVMVDRGIVKRKGFLIKVLGSGELAGPLVIQAHKFSKSAEAKIQAAGGRAEVIPSV